MVARGKRENDIPFLKAVAVVRCLRMSRRPLTDYYPLLIKKLQLQEHELKYVWVCRNWVMEEWQDRVPAHDKAELEKVWRCKFLYGWRGRQREQIDYKLAENLAKERSSMPSTTTTASIIRQSCKIQTWAQCWGTGQLGCRCRRISKISLEDLKGELKSFLNYYHEQLEKFPLPPQNDRSAAAKFGIENSNVVNEASASGSGNLIEVDSASADSGTLNGYGTSSKAVDIGSIGHMENCMMDRIKVYRRLFFVPREVLVYVGSQVFTTRTEVPWRKYVHDEIRRTRFIGRFRRKFGFLEVNDSSHPILPAEHFIYKYATVKLTRLRDVPVRPAAVEEGTQIENVLEFGKPQGVTVKQEYLPLGDVNEIGPEQSEVFIKAENLPSSTMPQRQLDKGSDRGVFNLWSRRMQHGRSRSLKRKKVQSRGKLWRTIVKVCSAPQENSASTSQGSSLNHFAKNKFRLGLDDDRISVVTGVSDLISSSLLGEITQDENIAPICNQLLNEELMDKFPDNSNTIEENENSPFAVENECSALTDSGMGSGLVPEIHDSWNELFHQVGTLDYIFGENNPTGEREDQYSSSYDSFIGSLLEVEMKPEI